MGQNHVRKKVSGSSWDGCEKKWILNSAFYVLFSTDNKLLFNQLKILLPCYIMEKETKCYRKGYSANRRIEIHVQQFFFAQIGLLWCKDFTVGHSEKKKLHTLWMMFRNFWSILFWGSFCFKLLLFWKLLWQKKMGTKTPSCMYIWYSHIYMSFSPSERCL